MKVTYSWLKDFVDIRVSPEKLADQLTMAGLSVAGLERFEDDWAYEIEVTSNRPDWLSVRGIAHEVAAITGGKLKRPQTTVHRPQKNKNRGPSTVDRRLFSITIDDKKACPVYYGNLIEGVKIDTSPEWLIRRLKSVGIRPVNNVVDITNYLLMESGQPLHAFDFNRVKENSIIVRRARQGEKLILIDGTEKILHPDTLLIADPRKPLAVAGIMGGQESEVSVGTTTILLESAYFDPVVVRRGSRRLGISSDSSYRFERGVDPVTVKTALDAATQMICELCGGRLIASHQDGKPPVKTGRIISFSLSAANEVLSLNLSARQARSILEKLGFKVKTKKANTFEITAPSFRQDINGEEDITEEVARVYGYEKIPLTKPAIRPFLMESTPAQILEPKLKSLCVALGLKEAVTYGLVSEKDYKKSSMPLPSRMPALENPLSEDQRLLRTTLIPSLLQCIAFNANHNNKDLEIFEIARVFSSEGKAKNSEKTMLSIGLCGLKRSSWQKESKPYTLFDLKGILEAFIAELGIRDWDSKFMEKESFSDAGAQGELLVGTETAGIFGKVSDLVKKSWGIKAKEDIFIAEVDVDVLAAVANLKKSYKPLSLTPSIYRDISVLANERAPFAAIKELIGQKARGLLRAVVLADCYQGKEIPKGSIGLTISVEYGSDQKTLTDTEINSIHQNVLDGLTKDLSLTLR